MNTFPIMGVNGGKNSEIPLAVIVPHEKQAYKNHSQSLKRLAERGGLSWCEALAVLEDRPWKRMDETEAMNKVLSIAKLEISKFPQK